MRGRPTLYSDEMLERAEHYIENFDDEEYGDAFPSEVGLARVLGVARQTLYNWADKEGREAFLDTLDKLSERQEQVLWNKGITGAFNANITKLALGNHGYSEKTDSTHRIESFSFPDYPADPDTES